VSPAEPQRVLVRAVGDVMLGRRVGERIGRLGPDVVTAPVDDLLAEADLVCGNLEAPLAGRAHDSSGLRADPAAVAALRRFDIVSVANNHIHDCGDEGIDATLATLTGAGIRYMGVGEDEEQALRPAVLSARGVRVAFIACVSRALLAPHVTRHRLGELESVLLEDVVAAARGTADAVIVNVHAGNEHVPFPPPSLRARAGELCRAGADVVVTHHPHVLGGFERIGRSLVWHSLGDFVFDGETEARRRGGLLTVEVGQPGAIPFDLTVTQITVDLRVAPAPPAVAAQALADAERVSRALAKPSYARTYVWRYLRALAAAQVQAIDAARRHQGASAAAKRVVRLLRFVPAHAAKLGRGRFR
jgi:poly-gamma-glutamate capsule biosynthesis protein CapA/YwtB (metallophosphatase superfamily)